MIDAKEVDSRKMDDYERALGTPSAQKIIGLLTCWSSLSLKELVQKTGLSESQVHNTLNTLMDVSIVEKKSRGIYALSNSTFSEHLKSAYEDIIEQNVGNILYFLSNNIDTLPLPELEQTWKSLIDQWEPFLHERFSRKVSSLASHVVDRLSLSK